MALRATTQVDALGTHDETGQFDLILVDECDWEDETEHLRLLQAKLNSYVQFVESGQAVRVYPDAVGRAPRIKIHFRYQITASAQRFLSQATGVLMRAGISLAYQIHESGSLV